MLEWGRMMSTLGCMRTHLTRMVFVGVLGIVLASAALMMPQVSWADGTKTEVSTPESSVPNATYDARQPGADDPRVKEGFAAYKAGDFKKAYDIWLPLAKAGNAEAQFRVGRLYQREELVSRDINLIKYWYEASANQNHEFATFNLGKMYALGTDVEMDFERAHSLLMVGANSGDVSSQKMLGILFAITETAHRDFSLAYKWLYIALRNGDIGTMVTIEKLNVFASVDERHEGIEKMREWLSDHPRK